MPDQLAQLRQFLSTPSARRATCFCKADFARSKKFLSTPSARRATHCSKRGSPAGGISIHALREEGDALSSLEVSAFSNFYPRPPRGGRRNRAAAQPDAGAISIHALREEGDTLVKLHRPVVQHISIHALREEGDGASKFVKFPFYDFYPRPPRGGRPLRCHPHRLELVISIHALREEGDVHMVVR